VRAAGAYREVLVVCATAGEHRRVVEGGVAAERCHLVRPGVDFSRVRRRRDAALRQRLGLDEHDYVILLAGESVRGANHHEGLWAGGILHVLEMRYKILIWGEGQEAASVERLGNRMVPPTLMRSARERLGKVAFEMLLPAADLVLAPASGRVQTLATATAMAAGLPIVGVAGESMSELLEDRHSALLVATPTPRLLAQRMLDLQADASLQWSIADTARTEAYEFYSMTRFLRQWREVLACGEAVTCPPSFPGG
jgi:glycosyltransferase involved in cell wall biosynthesis